MTCNWCRNDYTDTQITSLSVDGKEVFARLCAGCYFCWKHGPPRVERDEPFTAAQRELERFTSEFMDGLHKLRFT